MNDWIMLEKEPLGMVRSKVWVTNGKHTQLYLNLTSSLTKEIKKLKN